MWHHDGDTAVGVRKRSDAKGGAVRVRRVHFCRGAVVVDVLRHNQILRLKCGQICGRFEFHSALTVGNSNWHVGACHALEPQGVAFVNANQGGAGFKAFGFVAYETRPVFRARDDFRQGGKHLAAVTNAKRERVFTFKELAELIP